MRSFTFLPTLQILGAVGTISIFIFIRQKHTRSLLTIAFAIVILFSAQKLYLQYFTIFPKTQSDSFQYALSETLPFLQTNEHNYDKIILSNQNSLYQSYMFFLFNSRYDPKLYQKEGGTVSGGFAITHVIGKYEFRPIHWREEVVSPRTLNVGDIRDFPKDDSVQMIATLKNLDGKDLIVVAIKRL